MSCFVACARRSGGCVAAAESPVSPEPVAPPLALAPIEERAKKQQAREEEERGDLTHRDHRGACSGDLGLEERDTLCTSV